ncbi:DUF4179 domain-containing protein [Brevibacillus sp. FSL K6-0770]|uniref:DUF4179 domain-containing protein n=1 Tax=Brevibacillus parabrevis TaxID=54914 RepID=A0A4Y3PA69_BREPA|nr:MULTISPECIES: DUF4179 domain-containing protein [Brevibacillus]MDR5000890.1 DUF4179 domain-containing protein [Brevibacillus parabrevis]RNB93465.1 DUF4179 domain-containing protein [Brevibacillus parabrevis]GEB31400.1 hypothetical protein BPA01_09800 [Brevibacillus parabrevis]HBZ83515.1 hypothetical protein [Brevibacillus sp.]
MDFDTDMEKTKSQPLPDIEPYIRRGIAQAKEQKRMRRRNRLIRLYSGLAACCILFAFVLSVRISPAVAAYVSELPGMDKIVELIRDDRGLQRAVEHKMVQDIGTKASLSGITFTIDQVLTDQKRMLLFYTLKHEHTGQKVALRGVKLLDASGKEWEHGASWGSMGVAANVEHKDRIDVYVPEASVIPESLTAEVTFEIDDVKQDSSLAVTFPIDRSKYSAFEKKVYPVDKQITVDGQSLTIEQITVFPTQTEVSIRFDPANKKHIFGFDDLKLVDEKGQTYAFWGNGVPVRNNGENGKVFNLESIYFLEPQQLFLKASGIRALDRDKLQVVIDAKKQTLVKAPDDKLKLAALRQVDDVVGLDLELRVEEESDRHLFTYFGNDITDNRENKYEYVQGTTSTIASPDGRTQKQGLLFKRLTNKGTIDDYSLTLTDYPTRLQGEITVQVK